MIVEFVLWYLNFLLFWIFRTWNGFFELYGNVLSTKLPKLQCLKCNAIDARNKYVQIDLVDRNKEFNIGNVFKMSNLFGPSTSLYSSLHRIWILLAWFLANLKSILKVWTIIFTYYHKQSTSNVDRFFFFFFFSI